MNPDMAIWAANTAATLFLTGVIWTVQRVHYPAFDHVDRNRFVLFEQFHRARIGTIVVPAMLIELATGIALLFWRPDAVPRWHVLLGAMLIAVIWASTFALQAPLHNRLVHGYAADAVRQLVATNWIRTAAWTARGALALWGLALLVRA